MDFSKNTLKKQKIGNFFKNKRLDFKNANCMKHTFEDTSENEKNFEYEEKEYLRISGFLNTFWAKRDRKIWNFFSEKMRILGDNF